MVIAEALLIGLLLGLAAGGSLRGLQRERLLGEPLLLGLLPLQVVWPGLSGLAGLSCRVSVALWVAMMGALSIVMFLNGRRRWTLAIAGLGIAANVLVIGLNGAMPVSLRAVSETGLPRDASLARLQSDCLHEPLDDATVLAPLGDVLPVPGPAWQRGVLSIGDLLLALGLAAWVYQATRT